MGGSQNDSTKLGIRQGCLLSLLFYNTVLEILAGFQPYKSRKEEARLSPFAINMTL